MSETRVLLAVIALLVGLLVIATAASLATSLPTACNSTALRDEDPCVP